MRIDVRKTIKSFILNLLAQSGYVIGHRCSEDSFKELLQIVRNNIVSCDLERVGSSHDGGYLVPKCISTLGPCFSPGVGSKTNFEDDLFEKYGAISFLADGSLDFDSRGRPHLNFIKKYIGNKSRADYISLSEWVSDKVGVTDRNLILQLDIEGGEFDVLIGECFEFLNRFGVIVIEFHGVQRAVEVSFCNMMISIMSKLTRGFKIAHIHPNNCCGERLMFGVNVPCAMEFTFIRNDLIDMCKSKDSFSLPNRLDLPNVKYNEEIFLDESWWRQI